jgi:hypothetical protein
MIQQILQPRPGFNWLNVAWGAPDQRRTDRCSYCGDPFPENDEEFVPDPLEQRGLVRRVLRPLPGNMVGRRELPRSDRAQNGTHRNDRQSCVKAMELHKLAPCSMPVRRAARSPPALRVALADASRDKTPARIGCALAR